MAAIAHEDKWRPYRASPDRLETSLSRYCNGRTVSREQRLSNGHDPRARELAVCPQSGSGILRTHPSVWPAGRKTLLGKFRTWCVAGMRSASCAVMRRHTCGLDAGSRSAILHVAHPRTLCTSRPSGQESVSIYERRHSISAFHMMNIAFRPGSFSAASEAAEGGRVPSVSRCSLVFYPGSLFPICAPQSCERRYSACLLSGGI